MKVEDKQKANAWIKENYPDGKVETIGKIVEVGKDEYHYNVDKDYVEWDLLLELMVLYLGSSSFHYKELIKELESYIKLLEDRSGQLEVYVSNRAGMNCPEELIEEGKRRRNKIAELKDILTNK